MRQSTDREAFFRALGAEQPPSRDGIGTYREKSLHVLLKNMVCPDASCYEKRVGPYVADVLCGNRIFEIQTGSFYPLQKKIRYYLENTDYDVTIVHPQAMRKWVVWIDPEDGTLSPRRLSPKRGTPTQLLPELFWLSDLMPNERLHVKVYAMAVEEYRRRDGWGKGGKRGSHREEILPQDLLAVYTFGERRDFAACVPETLGERFDAGAFAKASGLRGRRLSAALHCLCNLKILTRGERIGRACSYIYEGLPTA